MSAATDLSARPLSSWLIAVLAIVDGNPVRIDRLRAHRIAKRDVEALAQHGLVAIDPRGAVDVTDAGRRALTRCARCNPGSSQGLCAACETHDACRCCGVGKGLCLGCVSPSFARCRVCTDFLSTAEAEICQACAVRS